MNEVNILDGLIEIDEALGIKKRVRQGGKKIQRRFKFSKNKNRSYNNATKTTKRITKSDRIKMSRTAKIAARKRKGKRSIANIKRKKSLRKRKTLGFDKH